MNSDLAYFDVSHNIEIMYLNDSNEFENEVNKQLEKKIELMEPTIENINLGNDENPRLIKIGLTINKFKKKKKQKKKGSSRTPYGISRGVCIVL